MLSSTTSASSKNDVGSASAGEPSPPAGIPGENHISIHERYNYLEKAYETLEGKHRKLQDELRRIQDQESSSRQGKSQSESHHVISNKFLDVFSLSTDWARDFFRIALADFSIDKFPVFRKHLKRVCWGSAWEGKDKLNVSHLVEAVVADILGRRILLAPFAGCTKSTNHEFSQLYHRLLQDDRSKANKWRATTLATYNNRDTWKPYGFSSLSGSIARYREGFYKSIAIELDTILGPIARHHFPEADHSDRVQQSLEFITAAGDLAITLGTKAAELRMMDKTWFECKKRTFMCNNGRMKGRFMEEYEYSKMGFRVDIVLRPGFLKYGDDDGEDMESCATWIPAMLDLGEFGDGGDSTPVETGGNSATDTTCSVAGKEIHQEDDTIEDELHKVSEPELVSRWSRLIATVTGWA